MKLKKKHFEVAKTITWFVDREYHPDFVTPTLEQIDLFTQIESKGSKHLTEEQIKIVQPMINGKINYDLNIKMIHEELKEWVMNGWGWYPPIASILEDSFKKRSTFRYYVKMLIKLFRKIREKGIYTVLMEYTGFSRQEKEDFSRVYFDNLNTQLSICKRLQNSHS